MARNSREEISLLSSSLLFIAQLVFEVSTDLVRCRKQRGVAATWKFYTLISMGVTVRPFNGRRTCEFGHGAVHPRL